LTAPIKNILDHFRLDSGVLSYERYGSGHINETYLITTQNAAHYILQKIDHNIFCDVPGLLENIVSVTEFLRKQADDPRSVPSIIFATDGNPYYRDDEGSFWRVLVFVEDTICLQQPETPSDFYESAVAFGRFQQQLKDFPAHTLHETIPNFHNTVDRYRIFRETLEKNPMGRANQVREEIDFALAREDEAGTLVRLLAEGKLPLRVTHNDTKLNNVLFDKATRKALCVIDLDTVMPGLSLYDYGDSIRFGAASAPEDEQDLSKMNLRLDLFESYTKGFLHACPDLTELERELLPLGAKLMTLECGVRFLTDYLDGDRYFAVHRPDHNLHRARTQFKLVADMETKWEQMHQIVSTCIQ